MLKFGSFFPEELLLIYFASKKSKNIYIFVDFQWDGNKSLIVTGTYMSQVDANNPIFGFIFAL